MNLILCVEKFVNTIQLHVFNEIAILPFSKRQNKPKSNEISASLIVDANNISVSRYVQADSRIALTHSDTKYIRHDINIIRIFSLARKNHTVGTFAYQSGEAP